LRTRGLLRLPRGVPAERARLAAFIVLSLALHLITVIGAGPLDLSLRRPGDAPPRTELQATLVTGESARPAAQPAPEGEKPAAGGEAAAVPQAGEPGDTARAGTQTGERGLALPAPDKWYTASEVDVRAEPITEIRLRYPRELAERVHGTVRVRVFIDEGGVVRKLQIDSSEPPGLFDEAAKQGWQDVRFSPARRNGVAVKSQKLIELTFTPATI
jgi:protein TonB